jgi:hypothetical protein
MPSSRIHTVGHGGRPPPGWQQPWSESHNEREFTMKYMIQWRVHEDKRHETLKIFSSMAAGDEDMAGVKLIGRWHDAISFTGVAIAETDDPKALTKWLLNWNSVIDIEAVPVLDDEETRALGREFTG